MTEGVRVAEEQSENGGRVVKCSGGAAHVEIPAASAGMTEEEGREWRGDGARMTDGRTRAGCGSYERLSGGAILPGFGVPAALGAAPASRSANVMPSNSA